MKKLSARQQAERDIREALREEGKIFINWNFCLYSCEVNEEDV